MDRVRTDANHGCPRFFEYLIAIPKSARLRRTSSRIIPRVEVEDNRIGSEDIPKVNWMVVLVRECEIGRVISHLKLRGVTL